MERKRYLLHENTYDVVGMVTVTKQLGEGLYGTVV